jgi:hypothetical protein
MLTRFASATNGIAATNSPIRTPMTEFAIACAPMPPTSVALPAGRFDALCRARYDGVDLLVDLVGCRGRRLVGAIEEPQLVEQTSVARLSCASATSC